METSESETIEPAYRPFVLRPTLFGAIPGLFLFLGTYLFWAPLQMAIGDFAYSFPAVGIAIPAIVYLERVVRYRKTEYRLVPGRIAIDTGSFFTEHSIELDLKNITLVEWKSPFFLRQFYDVGHILVQEAGSAAQNAKMTYVSSPEALYREIGDRMRTHGFSMARQRLIQQEHPGFRGAAVDLLYKGVNQIFVLAIIALQAADFLAAFRPGSPVWRVVTGDFASIETTLSPLALLKARIGIFVIGGGIGVFALAAVGFVFTDLLYRTYTLYDDVIDYTDGFFNESRQFIPLENLAGTEVSRPILKRLVGITDVKLSSRGADAAITFQSTPNGPAFAKAVERLVANVESPAKEAKKASRAGRDNESKTKLTDRVESEAEPLFREPDRTYAAATGISVGLFWSVALVPIFLFTFSFSDLGVVVAVLAAISVITAVAIGGSLFGIASQMVRAWATSYEFSRRGAKRTFDLFSQKETKFDLDRITSVSVLRNPLNRLMGTMSVKFRSIGSSQDLVFWAIPEDPELIERIYAQLGLDGLETAEATESLTPRFSLVDELKWAAPVYALGLGALFGVICLSYLGFISFFPTALGLTLLACILAIGFIAWRQIYIDHLTGEYSSDAARLDGGVFRLFEHRTRLADIKVVQSLRYPASRSGRLTFKTAGFPLRIEHLTDVQTIHRRVDGHLVGRFDDSADAERDSSTLVSYVPNPLTEVARHIVVALRTVLLIPFVPVTIPWTYLYYNRVNYCIQPSRLVAESGLYFDRTVTVLFGRIDHLERSKGFLNNMFDNEDIQIFTVGSRSSDLVFRSIDDSLEPLAKIRSHLDKYDDSFQVT